MKVDRFRMYFTMLALLLGLVCSGLAQQANMNLEGVIRDEASGAPVGVKIYIFTPSGKRISINSNSKDGTYLQTLAESGPHKIAIAGHNVYRKEEVVNVPASDKFKIIKQDFSVKTLVQGAQIASSSLAFQKNTAMLSKDGLQILSDLATLMKTNQAMNVVFSVAADEDKLAAAKAAVDAAYKKEHDAWAKAVAKLKKGQTPPVEPIRPPDPEDPNKALVQERIDTLKARMRPTKNSDVRVKYLYEPFPVQQIQDVVPVATPAASKGAAKNKKVATDKQATGQRSAKTVSIPQVVVRIGVVKDLMD